MNEAQEPRTRIRTIVVFSMLFVVFGAVVLFAYFSTFSRPVTTFGKAKVLRLKYGKPSTQGVGTGTMVPMNR